MRKQPPDNNRYDVVSQLLQAAESFWRGLLNGVKEIITAHQGLVEEDRSTQKDAVQRD